MSRASRIVTTVAPVAVATILLTGCIGSGDAPVPVFPPAPALTPVPEEPAPTPLPEWARGTTWLIYPDGFECTGTEGCPNDYRALIGEPGPVLPLGVEYYDPARHDCVVVHPLGANCAG